MESDRRSSFLFGRIFCGEPASTSPENALANFFIQEILRANGEESRQGRLCAPVLHHKGRNCAASGEGNSIRRRYSISGKASAKPLKEMGMPIPASSVWKMMNIAVLPVLSCSTSLSSTTT